MSALLTLVLLSACQPAFASNPAASGELTPPAATYQVDCAEAVPGAADCPTQEPAPPAQATRVASPTPTEQPVSPTPSPTPDRLSWSPPEDCGADTCSYAGVFLLERPIGPEGRDVIDFSYPFGSTQGGMRDPHHGVEFLNSFGTPVLAAADGQVIVAGDDREIFYGPYSYFYGNLIVLAHQLPGLDAPLYTLYAHLSEIGVEAGESVKAGQQIGRVGMSGVATGSHLHFEVRLGENGYENSRNPELWLEPHSGEDGVQNGGIAGRIVDVRGNYLTIPSIVVERLAAPEGPALWERYTQTYDEKKLAGLPPWEENFALGDLPPGWYRISFVQYGIQQRVVQVLPGELTMMDFILGNY